MFSFNLFGFDYLPDDSLYGMWVGSIKNWEEIDRNLFMVYYNNGEFTFDLFWYRVWSC